MAVLAGCTSSGEVATTPELEARDTVLTTVKPTRQDLVNKISLAGTVTINPVFGLVAPADGELRWVQRSPQKAPASIPLWVATVWDDNGAPQRIMIPKDSTLAGRLLEDRATVTKGMPVVSATYAGYGIVAEVDSAQAYRISGAVTSVSGQIKNGPGPFGCETLGTLAALPAGTIPEPPATTTTATQQPSAGPVLGEPPADTGAQGSEPTGMRLVCTVDGDVKLINGAAVTLAVVTGTAKKALVLPVEAVAGLQGKGKVDLVIGAERRRKTVDVVLGLSDGKVVQIKSGLTGNETVAIPGPNLPTPPPEAPDAPVAPGVVTK